MRMSILLLHTSNPSRRRHLIRAAEYAREHGERLLLVTKNPTWEHDIADAVVSAEISDIDATVQAVRELAATEIDNIRAVAAFREHCVPAAAGVAADLGLPFVSEQVARLTRDKYLLRKRFDTKGVPQPKYGLARTVDDAIHEAERIGYPVVVKPVVNNDALYLRRVDDINDLRQCFSGLQSGAWHVAGNAAVYDWARNDYYGAVIIEEFVPGPDLSVESVVVEGVVRVVAVHDKPNVADSPYLVDVLYTTPSRLPRHTQSRIHNIVADAHQAVGIDTGVTHTELRIGVDGTIKVLEIAARLGGGPIYQSVLLSTGVDLVDAVLDTACGREPVVRPQPRAIPTAFYLFFAERAGAIVTIDGVEEARLDPRVQELALYHGLGEDVQLPPQVWQSHGHVVYTADDIDEIDKMFNALVNTVKIGAE